MPTQSPRPSSIGGYLAGAAVAAERVIELAVTAIRPNPDQPRKDFPPESILELGQSIKDKGLQQPVVVRLVRPPVQAPLPRQVARTRRP